MRIDIITGSAKVMFSVRAVLLILAITCAAIFSDGSVLAGTADLTIISASPPAATTGSAYSYTFTASGGTPPYTWKAWLVSPEHDGSLTDFSTWTTINGLTFDTSTGVLSGVPVVTGALPFRVKVADSNYRSLTLLYDLNIGGTGVARAITNTPPSGIEGSAYGFKFATSWSSQLGCDPSLYFIEGSMPPGLSLNILSGDLGAPPAAYGIPLAAGSYTFTISAASNIFCIAEPTYTNARTFTINIAPSVSSSSPAGAAGWSKSASNPVLAPSTSGWDNGLLASPSVIKVGSTYMMYYEGQDKTTHTWHIGLATSTDGITWTRSAGNPVLSPGSGTWDAFEVRYPSVHYDGATYRMWYWGRNNIDDIAKIGLATSSNGITWTKFANPVLGADGYSGYIPGSVIKSGSTFIMWFGTQYGDIQRTTSSDGITWNTPQTVISNLGLKRPMVILDGGVYRAWFTKWDTGDNGGLAGTVSDEIRLDIGYGSSTDGITWMQYTNSAASCGFCVTSDNIIASLSHGSPSAWDRPGVGQPWVIKDGIQYKMWYTGGRIHRPYYSSLNNVSFVEGAIGYATSGGGTNLVKNSETSVLYSSIQTAYDAAETNQSLLIQAVDFTEDLNLNGDIVTSLYGGYDSGFTSPSGFTVIHGKVTIGLGTVTILNVIIK